MISLSMMTDLAKAGRLGKSLPSPVGLRTPASWAATTPLRKPAAWAASMPRGPRNLGPVRGFGIPRGFAAPLRKPAPWIARAPLTARPLSPLRGLPSPRGFAPPVGKHGFRSLPTRATAPKNRHWARKIALGGLGVAVVNGAINNRSGRAADRMGRGRPTGPYMY